MAAVTAGASPAAGPDRRGPVPARTTGPATADRSPASARPGRTLRSWPLLVLAAPAAAEVWSGWVGIAQKTGFGLVSPLPGIWPALHLDTTVTRPVGVEAYAAYALRAWLSGEPWISDRTRRFAKWSAISSFALGMAGQVAYHLLAQAGAARAPWPVTMIVSCLPVLVLAMGTSLARMLRADTAPDAPDSEATGPATAWSPDQSAGDQRGPDQDQRADRESGPPAVTRRPVRQETRAIVRTTAPEPRDTRTQTDQAHLIARRLAATGKPISRRALRDAGVKGSNESLNALAPRSTPNQQTGRQAPRRRRRPGSPANAARPLQSGPHSHLDKRKRTDTSLDFAQASSTTPRTPARNKQEPLSDLPSSAMTGLAHGITCDPRWYKRSQQSGKKSAR